MTHMYIRTGAQASQCTLFTPQHAIQPSTHGKTFSCFCSCNVYQHFLKSAQRLAFFDSPFGSLLHKKYMNKVTKTLTLHVCWHLQAWWLSPTYKTLCKIWRKTAFQSWTSMCCERGSNRRWGSTHDSLAPVRHSFSGC